MTKFAIPEAALDTHIGILGRTGSGKTFTARGMVERLLDAQRQVVIVDPTGAWWGLRSTFAIPIFGGEHGDVEITDQSGEAVAETILTHHSSAIVDLSGLARQSGAGMRRFMAAFIARLKDRERGALWLVLDEADEFLPQVLQPDMTRLFGDLKWIVRRGRVAGWRVMMITQRPQDIAKSVLTQIGTLVAHRLTAPQDRKAVEEWVKGHADPEEAKAVLSSLAGLQRGEAWVWSPENELLERAVMPVIRSFDSGATPDADSGAITQPELASIDMAAIRATLEAGASSKGLGTPSKVVVCANCTAKDAEINTLLDKIAQIEGDQGFSQQDYINAVAGRDHWEKIAAKGLATIDRVKDALGDNGDLSAPPATPRPPLKVAGPIDEEKEWQVQQINEKARFSEVAPRPVPKPARQPPFPRDTPPASTQRTTGDVPAGCAKPLATLAAVYPSGLTEPQWALAAGYKRSGGTWGTYKSRLRGAGLIESREGRWFATEAGAQSIGDVETPPAPGPDLVRWWAARLPGTSRIAEALIDAHPRALGKEDLAAAVKMSAVGGSFGTYLSRLAGPGVIDRSDGLIRLSAEIMQ